MVNSLNSPSKRSRSLTSLLTMVLLIVAIIDLSSCAIKPIPLTTDEVQSRVKEDRAVLIQDQEPVSGPIDLYEAMARALKYNLDARVELMHKMLAQTQLDLSHYAMLPRLAVNAGFDGRSNYCGGTVAIVDPGQRRSNPLPRPRGTCSRPILSLSWNVLDFGMSYIRAKQAADDVLIAEEERRRVANRVMQDVRSAYWRAVSAERILPSLKMLDEWVKSCSRKGPSRSGRKAQYTACSLAIQARSPQYATLHSTAVPGALHSEASIGRADEPSPRPRAGNDAHGSGAGGTER